MKIIQINAVNGLRSTGRTSVELADYLNDGGHDCYIAYSTGLPYYKGFKIGNPIDTKFHGLFSRLSGKQSYFSKNATQELLDYIEKINPDIVHLRNLHANYINLEMLLKFLTFKDIATVLTLHDCWFYTGKCTHYTIDECDNWKSGCGNCPRLKKDNPSWFFDRTITMFKDKKELFNKIPRLAVVGVSDWITNEAEDSLLKSANILTRIYNWIDLEVFKPRKNNTKRNKLQLNDKFIILGVASGWSNSKGLDKFIELSKIINNDMKIVLIGNVDEEYELPNTIFHMKETHNVTELVDYYSAADVLLNLSPEETFGKVTAESLACGTPTITLNSTANPELIGERCGYVVENDINEVHDKIVKVKNNGKSFYSKSCINFAKSKFKKEDRINDYINLYKLLISGETKC